MSRGRQPQHELTAPELARYLFGDPLDDRDEGLIGRLSKQLELANKRVDLLIRLAWAIITLLFGALLTLAVDLTIRLGGKLP